MNLFLQEQKMLRTVVLLRYTCFTYAEMVEHQYGSVLPRTIFPPALKSFGIAPDKIIFIDLKKEKEILWAMEEALKCDGLQQLLER